MGVPYQVARAGMGAADVRRGEERRRVNTLLIDETLAPGDWVLVWADQAVRRMEPDEAQQVSDALMAVARAANGEDFEHLLADLIDREPQLPPHLREEANGRTGD